MHKRLKGLLFIILSLFFISWQPIIVRFIKVNEYTLYAYYELFFLIFFVGFLFAAKKKSAFKFKHNPKLLLQS